MTKRARFRIATRLTLWYGLGMLVLTAAVALIVGLALHFEGGAAVHEKLFSAHNKLQPLVVETSDSVTGGLGLDEMDASFSFEGPLALFVRILGTDGTVIEASPNAFDLFDPILPETLHITEVELRHHGVVYRVMYSPVIIEDHHAGWIETSAYGWVGRQGLSIHRFVPILLFIVILSLLGGHFLARRALAPVGRLSKSAASISSADLSVRLSHTESVSDEISHLTSTINSMLARIETGFQREKVLTADAAHEMMNPLTVIATEIEISERKERSAAELKASLQRIQSATRRLSTILSGLLSISRLQNEDSSASAEMLWGNLVSGWKSRALELEMTFNTRTEENIDVDALPQELLLIASVLVDNALKYSDSGAVVDISLRFANDSIELSVADDGIGLTDEEIGRLFDRFYRSSREEVMARSGHGLGLAIASAAAARIGAQLDAKSEGEGRGSTFSVTLEAD